MIWPWGACDRDDESPLSLVVAVPPVIPVPPMSLDPPEPLPFGPTFPGSPHPQHNANANIQACFTVRPPHECPQSRARGAARPRARVPVMPSPPPRRLLAYLDSLD